MHRSVRLQPMFDATCNRFEVVLKGLIDPCFVACNGVSWIPSGRHGEQLHASCVKSGFDGQALLGCGVVPKTAGPTVLTAPNDNGAVVFCITCIGGNNVQVFRVRPEETVANEEHALVPCIV
jgi:hypothetical protein